MALCFLFFFFTKIGFGCLTGEERDVQKSYWMEHSAELTVEAMMLDSQASDLDKEERPEVSNSVGSFILIFCSFSGASSSQILLPSLSLVWLWHKA